MSAQWTTGSGGGIYYNGGNVGINTSSPGYITIGGTSGHTTLQIDGNVDLLNWSEGYIIGTGPAVAGMYMPLNTTDLRFQTSALDRVAINANGDVGIGTTSPDAKLDVRGVTSQNSVNTVDSGGYDLQVLSSQNRPWDGAIIALGGAWGPTGYIKTAAISGTAGDVIIGNRRSPTDAGMTAGILLDTSGNVGIGTLAPQYPLSVNGTIQAKEVIVNTGWSDYVFDPRYKLMPLPQVAMYIKQHHHLPGVPSEAQVKQKGVSLGEMQSTLLAKVEELTLHMIDTDKRESRLEEENRKLIEQTHRLEQRVAQLEAGNGQ